MIGSWSSHNADSAAALTVIQCIPKAKAVVCLQCSVGSGGVQNVEKEAETFLLRFREFHFFPLGS